MGRSQRTAFLAAFCWLLAIVPASGRPQPYRLVGRPLAMIERFDNGDGTTYAAIVLYVRLNRHVPYQQDQLDPGLHGGATLDEVPPGGEGFLNPIDAKRLAHPCYVQHIESEYFAMAGHRFPRVGTRHRLDVTITGLSPRYAVVARITTTVRITRNRHLTNPDFYPRTLGCIKYKRRP